MQNISSLSIQDVFFDEIGNVGKVIRLHNSLVMRPIREFSPYLDRSAAYAIELVHMSTRNDLVFASAEKQDWHVRDLDQRLVAKPGLVTERGEVSGNRNNTGA